MNKCVPLNNVKLDIISQKALKTIRDKKNAGDMLAATVTVGVFSSIFTKSNPPQAAFNITQTDWSLYTKAMKAVPVITKRAIEKEVEFMILHYQLHNNPKLLQFWQGVYSGCK